MDLFRSAPVAPAIPAPNGNPSQVANPGQNLPGTQASPQTANNGIVPAQSPAPAPAEKAEPTPMEGFKDIWQTVKTEDGVPASEMFANLDPKKVMESAQKVDFTKTLTPEILAKAAAGGQEGIAALVSAMNSVAQSGYAQNAIATTKIVQQALKKQKEEFDAQLPTMVRKLSANENILAENPLFNNPAIQPLVGALQEQLVRKNPNATSKEIQTQVGDFFTQLGQNFAPPSKADKEAKSKSGREEDWSAFLS